MSPGRAIDSGLKLGQFGILHKIQTLEPFDVRFQSRCGRARAPTANKKQQRKGARHQRKKNRVNHHSQYGADRRERQRGTPERLQAIEPCNAAPHVLKVIVTRDGTHIKPTFRAI